MMMEILLKLKSPRAYDDNVYLKLRSKLFDLRI